MLLLTGLRRTVSAVQRLFNSASFSAPLTHSLVPERGTGSPSFTRADATNCATFRDWEGVLKTVPSGCARFEGGRMVYNLWTTSSATLANGANKSLTLAAGDYTFSMGAGTGTATFSGTGGATGTLAASASGRVEVTKTITVGTFVVTASVADLVDLQVEYVTGQADQTASEYVSVGVESDPYHGAGVDGVEFFNTDRDGAVIPAATNTGYLAEGARTNLTIWNRDLTNAAWTRRSGAVTTALTATGADGAANSATAVRNLGASGVADVYQTAAYAVASGTRVEPSLSLRTVSTSGTLHFANAYDVGASGSWNIDLSLVSTTRMERITRDHPAVTVTTEWIGSSLNFVQPIFDTASGPLDFDVDLIQVEVGTTSTSEIPTTTTAVTRATDVDANPTASNILAAASTVYLEFTPDHTPSGTIALWGTYVDASNYTAILHDATNLIFRKRIAGSNYDATIANAFTANTTYKVCGSWGASGVTVTLNGTEGTPHANTTAAQIAATMQWGADGNSLQQPFATERNARVWQRQLSASEMQSITA